MDTNDYLGNIQEYLKELCVHQGNISTSLDNADGSLDKVVKKLDGLEAILKRIEAKTR